MKIIRNYKNCPSAAYGYNLVIGNVDAVHRGHKNLFKRARELSDKAALFSFYPHTRTVLDVAQHLSILSLKEKIERLELEGVKYLFLQKFNNTFSRMSPENFVKEVLVDHLKVKNIIVGDNFRFGYEQKGNIETLLKLSKELSFGVHVVSTKDENGDICSSSKIRVLLKEGNMDRVMSELGYGYSITGRVVYGKQRGQSIGFPTANIRLKNLLVPKLGVYGVRVYIEDNTAEYIGVSNLGSCPTFGESEILLETHILDFNQDIYDKKIKVVPLFYIREQKKFNDIPALINQISKDIDECKEKIK